MKNTNSEWKSNYDVYLEDLRKAYKEIVTNDFIKEYQDLYPELDIKKTIIKSCKTFWATPEGWKNKKRKHTTKINWKKTFINSLNFRFNKVYKSLLAFPWRCR